MDCRDEGQLTVGELIEKLKKLPQDALVWYDSGDGHDPALDVEVSEYRNSIIITTYHEDFTLDGGYNGPEEVSHEKEDMCSCPPNAAMINIKAMTCMKCGKKVPFHLNRLIIPGL